MSISAISSSATQYPILVNGYLCYSATEVQSAKSGMKPEQEGATTSTASSTQIQSSALSAQPSPKAEPVQQDDKNKLLGRVIDIYA